MSELPPPHLPTRFTRSLRGQSFAEFALVLPMMLVLLLGIADFGRVFQAGIMVESASRNAAEVAAQEYLQALRQAPSSTIDYEAIHESAARVACQELEKLPNTTFLPDGSGGTCPSMPVVLACVHDGTDPECGQPVSGFSTVIPNECPMQGDDVPTGGDNPWSPAAMGGSEPSSYVEVRVCYHFTTLFNLDVSLPFNAGLSLGDVYIGDRSVFTVADY